MKRIEWVLVFLPFFLSWTIDRLLKLWAVNLNRHLEFGFVNFALVYNPGAIFGLFSELPPLLRVVSLSTAGIFIFCIYILLQYLMPFKSLILRGGMSLLIGGILGNVADRVLYGHVIDYIFFRFGTWSTPVFNFADGIQWLGYGMIVLSLFREGGVFWPENNSRNKYWINLPFQLKYCFFLLGVGLGISLIVSVFSYTYLRVTLLDVAGNNQNILNRYLSPFLFTFLLITFGIALSLFSVGKIISHRIAGPLFAFERYLRQLLENQDVRSIHTFRLRAFDEFKQLETLAHQIKKRLEKDCPEHYSNKQVDSDVSSDPSKIPLEHSRHLKG